MYSESIAFLDPELHDVAQIIAIIFKSEDVF